MWSRRNLKNTVIIWLAERQSVHRRTDRRMDRATHLHNKQRSDSVKFHRMLFYLCRYTIKLLLTELSVHREIFVLTFKAHGPHCVRSIRLECQNKYFLLLYTDWNTQRILWSDWLRGSPYIGVRTGVWTGQRTNAVNNALTRQSFLLYCFICVCIQQSSY